MTREHCLAAGCPAEHVDALAQSGLGFLEILKLWQAVGPLVQKYGPVASQLLAAAQARDWVTVFQLIEQLVQAQQAAQGTQT